MVIDIFENKIFYILISFKYIEDFQEKCLKVFYMTLIYLSDKGDIFPVTR